MVLLKQYSLPSSLPFFSDEKLAPFNKLQSIDQNILSMCSLFLVLYQEIALIFMLFSFLFVIPTISYRQVG